MIHKKKAIKINNNGIFTFVNGICEDQFVGYFHFNNGSFYSVNKDDVFDLACDKNINGQGRISLDYDNKNIHVSQTTSKKMVILLESPHINEFNVQNKKYKTAPAWGKTGARFNSFFIKILNYNLKNIGNCFKNNDVIDVYFVNAIRYQCSLGISPINKSLRDFIFYALWDKQNDSFKDDLLERVQMIDPDYLIIAPTKNIKEKCFRSNPIPTSAGRPVFFTAETHPSCWNKNTTII
ncbi:MAG: hypothetical protein J6Y28_01960 [Acholeplasmatales bacterium]|nr:hypothetical protein [Acholeplasmatales bacterium]